MQHDAAHEQESQHPAEILDHPMVFRGAAKMVSTQPELLALIARLRQAGSFAYDSEFIGELTYIPKLCLIQVASTTEIALIDPIADIDLNPFWELICDEQVQKIVHAGQQDIEPVVRHLNRSPKNIFDTQINAGFVGLTYPVALSKLILELLGARIGKGLTFTKWDQRPLSNQQLRYAADDVRYLPAIAKLITAQLEQANHLAWAQEECQGVCDAKNFQFDPKTLYLRIRGTGSLTARGMAILRELVQWRDAAARAQDVPPRTLMRDELMVDLSRSPAKSLEKLAGMRHMPHPTVSEHGQEILAAIARGQAVPAKELPDEPDSEPPPSVKFKVETLWSITQAICTSRGIDPALVTSRQQMNDIAKFLRGEIDSSQIPLLNGWRHQAVGGQLIDAAKGLSELKLSWKI